MNISEWLQSVDLAEYTLIFEENELEVEHLADLTSDDLKNELGIRNLVHRKKFLAEIDKLRKASNTVPSEWPDGLHPEKMPTFLARPWHSFNSEEHPRVQLHWMMDTAELALRWSVAICLGDVLKASEGVVPEKIASRIRDHVERPTLGRWLRILLELNTFPSNKQLVAPTAFELYHTAFSEPFRNEDQGGSQDTSLLVMRNHLAHGGGISRQRSEHLLQAHLPTFQDILQKVVAATNDLEIISTQSGIAYSLKGMDPIRQQVPPPIGNSNDGLWLIGKESLTHLLPIARHTPVQKVQQDGNLATQTADSIPQLYARCTSDRISYTPIGVDESHSDDFELASFQRIFRLDEPKPGQSVAATDEFRWDDFIREARVLSEDLIGRRKELDTVKRWMKTRLAWNSDSVRIGWIEGGPGLGKSLLMDRLVSDYSNANPKTRRVFYHRFRSGDARNSIKSFLTLLNQALIEWEVLSTENAVESSDDLSGLEENARKLLQAIPSSSTGHPKAPPPEFWIFLDGIDEAIKKAPELPKVVSRLALPGSVWLAAGRPDANFVAAAGDSLSERVFESGLPPMSLDDVRAMLLEGLGNGRYPLLRKDRESGDEVRNSFVQCVAEKAHGLPLYVHFVIEDMKAGHLTVNYEERLPDGLTAYYDAMMDRIGLGDVKAILPPIICLLSIAEEPLDRSALTLLISANTEDFDIYSKQVEQAIHAGQALLRSAPTADSTTGWSLYHQSFREHVAASAQGGPLSGQLDIAWRKLLRNANNWSSLPDGNLRNHLFRWGTYYAIQSGLSEQLTAAYDRLVNFHYLQARTSSLPPAQLSHLPMEYAELSSSLQEATREQSVLSAWQTFFEQHQTFLASGTTEWPSNRILLQLALDYAIDSCITLSAETWLEDGNCDWTFLRMNPDSRPPLAARPQGMTTLGQHDSPVNNLAVHGDILASAGRDGIVKLWDLRRKQYTGSITVPSGAARMVGFSFDGTKLLTVTDQGRIHEHAVNSETEIRSFRHTIKRPETFRMAKAMMALAGDNHIHVWNHDDTKGARLFGHKSTPLALEFIDNERKLISIDDRRLYIWDLQTKRIISSHRLETEAHDMGRVDDTTLYTLHDGDQLVLRSTSDPISVIRRIQLQEKLTLVRIFSDRNICIGIRGNELLLMDFTNGELLATLRGHAEPINDVLVVPDGPIIASASGSIWRHGSAHMHDRTIRLWNLDNALKHSCLIDGHQAHLSSVKACAFDRSQNRLLTSDGEITFVWDALTGKKIDELKGAQRIQACSFSEQTLVVFFRHGRTDLTLDPSYRQQIPIRHNDQNIMEDMLLFGDNKRLLLATSSGLEIYDLKSRTRLSAHGIKRNRQGSIDISPNQRMVLACYGKSLFCLWNIDDDRRALTYREEDGLEAVKFISDTEVGILTLKGNFRTIEICSGKILRTSDYCLSDSDCTHLFRRRNPNQHLEGSYVSIDNLSLLLQGPYYSRWFGEALHYPIIITSDSISCIGAIGGVLAPMPLVCHPPASKTVRAINGASDEIKSEI